MFTTSKTQKDEVRLAKMSKKIIKKEKQVSSLANQAKRTLKSKESLKINREKLEKEVERKKTEMEVEVKEIDSEQLNEQVSAL